MAPPARSGRFHRPARHLSRVRGRTSALISTAALLVAGLLAAGCAAGAPSRSEFVDALRTAGLAEADAACVADAVLRELSEDEVALIADRGPSGAPVDQPEAGDDALERVRAAIAECQVAPEPTPDDAETPGSDTPAIPDDDVGA
jgi:hypothetical protein